MSTVVVTLRGNAITIDPWRVEVGAGDVVTWQLETDREGAVMNARNKPDGGENHRPLERETPAGPEKVKRTRVRPGAALGLHRYDIEVTFREAGGEANRLIDPEMIIRR